MELGLESGTTGSVCNICANRCWFNLDSSTSIASKGGFSTKIINQIPYTNGVDHACSIIE